MRRLGVLMPVYDIPVLLVCLSYFQYDTCDATPDLSNVINGPHNIDWTNIHTHGLKVGIGLRLERELPIRYDRK